MRLAHLAILLGLLLGCAVTGGEGPRPLELACSPWNPAVQTAVLEAVVTGGGPLVLDVAGWMCGRTERGVLVRIVFLHYQTERPEIGRAFVPAVFEDGRLVAFGWHLFEVDPDRYGAPIEASHWGPPEWTVPQGWVVVR